MRCAAAANSLFEALTPRRVAYVVRKAVLEIAEQECSRRGSSSSGDQTTLMAEGEM